MAADSRVIEAVSVDRVFLDPENPRHDPIEVEAEIIDTLCRDEQVPRLARHIAENGINPLELFGLLRLKRSLDEPQAFVVGEGNRRFCAIKLLNDPALAPSKLRSFFEDLSANTPQIDELPAVIFEDAAELDVWKEVTHGGVQRGIGRKPWNSEQKTRHTGVPKNQMAQALLDYAEDKGFITTKEREKKLTTVQRYLSNPIVRDAIGIERDGADINRTRPTSDFDKIVNKFVKDLVDGTVNSRANKSQIEPYGRSLDEGLEIDGARLDPVKIDQKDPNLGKEKGAKPAKPKSIHYDKDIVGALKALNNEKLNSLYYSICKISLKDHCPLASVGAWAFVESLTALHGRSSNTDFVTYLSSPIFSKLGLGDKKKYAPVKDALQRLSRHGNATKHHPIAATFDAAQLINDLATVTPFIVAIANDASDIE